MRSANVRRPAVAGLFYPADPHALAREVERLLAQAAAAPAPPPKAIIVPHAGYIYSGPIAASAYARLRAARDIIRRVVLLGPAHRVGFHGLALPSAQYFESPLGRVPLDARAIERIADLPQVLVLDHAHAEEHSLEVHLPFLQALFADFALVPLVVGQAGAAQVGEVIERLWGGPETLIVVSSDLSHYYPYETAQRLDRATSAAIEALRYEALGDADACGCIPISGLLHVARQRGLAVRTIDLRNSGDTAGPRDRVVGYGAYLVQ
ncbi:MAG TPA: AmmeMemoRadiSam system protein B [Burkholderiales bacterium]